MSRRIVVKVAGVVGVVAMAGMIAAPAQAASREHSRHAHEAGRHEAQTTPVEPDPAPVAIPKGLDPNDIELGIIR